MKLPNRFVFILCLFAFTTVNGAEDTTLSVVDPWVRAAPPGAMVLAGYMQLKNTSAHDIVITRITSPDFAMIEMHRTVVRDGLAKMLPQAKLKVPAHGSLTLHPGDLHLMMMQPQRPLKPGDTVELSLHTSASQEIAVQVPVQK